MNEGLQEIKMALQARFCWCLEFSASGGAACFMFPPQVAMTDHGEIFVVAR